MPATRERSSLTRRQLPTGVLAVFVVALLIRLTAIAMFQGLNAPPKRDANPDQVEYEAVAYSVSVGDCYCIAPGEPTALRTPGAPLSMLVPYLVFGHSYLAARVWIALISAATCALAAWFVGRFAGAAVGLVTGLWLAAYPGHLYYATHFLSEPFYGFWLIAAAALTCHALEGGRLWLAFRDRERMGWAILAAPLVVCVVVALLTYGSPRFRDAMSPLFVPFAALGLVRVAQRAMNWRDGGRDADRLR